jgi:hypothetical protein
MLAYLVTLVHITLASNPGSPKLTGCYAVAKTLLEKYGGDGKYAYLDNPATADQRCARAFRSAHAGYVEFKQYFGLASKATRKAYSCEERAELFVGKKIDFSDEAKAKAALQR